METARSKPVFPIDIGTTVDVNVTEFADIILELREQCNCTVLEAIVEYCFRNNISVDEVTDLIPDGLKALMAQEENINLYDKPEESLDLM